MKKDDALLPGLAVESTFVFALLHTNLKDSLQLCNGGVSVFVCVCVVVVGVCLRQKKARKKTH